MMSLFMSNQETKTVEFIPFHSMELLIGVFAIAFLEEVFTLLTFGVVQKVRVYICLTAVFEVYAIKLTLVLYIVIGQYVQMGFLYLTVPMVIGYM